MVNQLKIQERERAMNHTYKWKNVDKTNRLKPNRITQTLCITYNAPTSLFCHVELMKWHNRTWSIKQ